jgi:hypothetical protein
LSNREIGLVAGLSTLGVAFFGLVVFVVVATRNRNARQRSPTLLAVYCSPHGQNNLGQDLIEEKTMMQNHCAILTRQTDNLSFEGFCTHLGSKFWKYLHMAGHGNLPFPGPPVVNTFCFIGNANTVEAATDPREIANKISRFGADSFRYEVENAEERGNLKLVFLNGCKTDFLASGIQGVRYVVYWETIVHIDAAKMFAEEFYTSLRGGYQWDHVEEQANSDVERAFDRAYSAFENHQDLHLGDPLAKDPAGDCIYWYCTAQHSGQQEASKVHAVEITANGTRAATTVTNHHDLMNYGVNVDPPKPASRFQKKVVQLVGDTAADGTVQVAPQMASILTRHDDGTCDLMLHDGGSLLQPPGTRVNGCRFRGFHGKPRMRVATTDQSPAPAAAGGMGAGLLGGPAVWEPALCFGPAYGPPHKPP